MSPREQRQSDFRLFISKTTHFCSLTSWCSYWRPNIKHHWKVWNSLLLWLLWWWGLDFIDSIWASVYGNFVWFQIPHRILEVLEWKNTWSSNSIPEVSVFWRRCMGGWRAMLCSVFIRTKATCAKRCWESPPLKGPQEETCGFCCQSAVEQMCFLGWRHADVRSVVHLVHSRETERQTTGCCQLLYKEVRQLGALTPIPAVCPFLGPLYTLG